MNRVCTFPHTHSYPSTPIPLHPTYSLTCGTLQSTTTNPIGGLRSLAVERDMEVPTDALKLRLAQRQGIALGDAVTLALGYEEELETVFVGTVTVLKPTIAGLEVWAMGAMQPLVALHVATVFENQTVGNIVQNLAQMAGLTPGTVSAGPLLPVYRIDSRLSAFGHLKALANRLGYELYCDRTGHLNCHNPAAAGGLALNAMALGYTFGRDLLAATAYHQPPHWGTVVIGAESPMSRQGDDTVHWLTTSEDTQRSGRGSPERLVLDPVARTQDLARQFAAGHLTTATRAAQEVGMRVLGRPGVDLGDAASPSDFPDSLLNGRGYVRALRHRLSDRAGFITDLRIALGDEP